MTSMMSAGCSSSAAPRRAGFTLEEIGELLALDRTDDRARVRELATERLAALDVRIAELESSRAALERLRATCASGTKGRARFWRRSIRPEGALATHGAGSATPAD